MNEELKEELKRSINENFGQMNNESHELLYLIRKDEPEWCSDD